MKLTVSLPPYQIDFLKRVKKRTGVPVSTQVRKIVEVAIKRAKQGK